MRASRNPLERLGVRELDKGLASFRARELRRAAREILLTEKRIKRSEDKTRAKVKHLHPRGFQRRSLLRKRNVRPSLFE